MNNLIIDQGNTRTKLALFRANQMVEFRAIDNDFAQETIELFCDEHAPSKCIFSSVIEDENILNYLQKKIPHTVELNEVTPLPFTNSYASGSTLGKDRLAAIAGAYNEKPNCNCLVIDAGTAITYDLIDFSGVYKGGSIAPGLQMRFKALHSFTSKLPQVSANPNLPITGNDTVSSINSGVYHGMIQEINGFISHYTKYYPGLFVFLTGGDALIFEKSIKNSIFAAPNLVLSGLNSLLEYNNAE